MPSPYVCAVCGNAITLGRHKSGWRHSSDGHYDHQVIPVARREHVRARQTRVAIVVSRDFSTELLELANRFDVWVLDTPANRRASEAIWADHKIDHAYSVTTFKEYEGESTETSLVDLLPIVDDHHGLREEWAGDIVLEVIGQPLTDAIRDALEVLGPFVISERRDGFTATRATTA